MRLGAVLIALLGCAAAVLGLATNVTDGGSQGRRMLQTGNFYRPIGGRGSWEDPTSTGIVMIHASVMKGGEVVEWQAAWMGKLQERYDYSAAVYFPEGRRHEALPTEGGINEKNSFCGAQVTTPDQKVLIFGGHYMDLQWFREYDHTSRQTWRTMMPSGRWYPGVATLGDGRVLVVGGVLDSGTGGYSYTDQQELDNPSYMIYTPATRDFSQDKWDMKAQLSEAFPIHTYPHVILLPDGGVAVSAGRTLVRYRRDGDSFKKYHELPERPGAPWSYPQTGQGIALPIAFPWNKMYLLSAGGSAQDQADEETPATSAAHIIELTGGTEAKWWSVGPMPFPRVMGDSVLLCDGTIGFFGGARRGIAGWNSKGMHYTFPDGTEYDCEDRCTKAFDFNYEPVLFDPATKKWSQPGSLATSKRPRLYHSVAVLMPDCRVMTAGGDVTNDNTAEFWSPPYLSKGPRPRISWAPGAIFPGDEIAVKHGSADPVTKALLIRTGTHTHSMAFDARAVWLTLESKQGDVIKFKTPANPNMLPPGMYMLTILSGRGVPSEAKILSVFSRG